MAKRSFYVKDSELDDYQVKVINKKTDNSYIVKGCAGSGKSILALWKAKQIQDEHKGTFLYVVYTKSLRQYMNDGIMQVGLPEMSLIMMLALVGEETNLAHLFVVVGKWETMIT